MPEVLRKGNVSDVVCVNATHTSLLLLLGSTLHTVPEPTVTMWVLPLMMAGRRGDWNSQPYNVTSVSAPAGAVLGENCREKRGKKHLSLISTIHAGKGALIFVIFVVGTYKLLA